MREKEVKTRVEDVVLQEYPSLDPDQQAKA